MYIINRMYYLIHVLYLRHYSSIELCYATNKKNVEDLENCYQNLDMKFPLIFLARLSSQFIYIILKCHLTFSISFLVGYDAYLWTLSFER